MLLYIIYDVKERYLHEVKEMKKSILVIFGGSSPEYEVSCNSGASLIDAIDKEKYEVYPVGITKKGEWILTDATFEEIRNGQDWLKSKGNKRAYISPDRSVNGLVVIEENKFFIINIDCVFPIIHGETGEDGTLQGLLELASIPYVGSNILASACSMDKAVTRIFAERANLAQPECYILSKQMYLKSSRNEIEKIDNYFKKICEYPLFVKPSSTGSSIGVSRVESKGELKAAIESAFEFDTKVLIEEGIEGSEIKVSILGNEDIKVGELLKVTVETGFFYDYKTKYITGGSKKELPAIVPEVLKKEIKESAKRIYNDLGCKGFARVDFFLSDENKVIFNEINTVPGFSKSSNYPLMFKEIGLEYKDMISELINLEIE